MASRSKWVLASVITSTSALASATSRLSTPALPLRAARESFTPRAA